MRLPFAKSGIRSGTKSSFLPIEEHRLFEAFEISNSLAKSSRTARTAKSEVRALKSK